MFSTVRVVLSSLMEWCVFSQITQIYIIAYHCLQHAMISTRDKRTKNHYVKISEHTKKQKTTPATTSLPPPPLYTHTHTRFLIYYQVPILVQSLSGSSHFPEPSFSFPCLNPKVWAAHINTEHPILSSKYHPSLLLIYFLSDYLLSPKLPMFFAKFYFLSISKID